MLKPAGTLSFASGSLSGAAASGGAATGASLAAASPSGRPIRGEPGGSAGAAAGAAPAAGVVACCADAANVNAPKKAPASNRLRDAVRLIVMMVLPYVEALSIRGRAHRRADGFPGRHSPIICPRNAIGNILAKSYQVQRCAKAKASARRNRPALPM